MYSILYVEKSYHRFEYIEQNFHNTELYLLNNMEYTIYTYIDRCFRLKNHNLLSQNFIHTFIVLHNNLNIDKWHRSIL